MYKLKNKKIITLIISSGILLAMTFSNSYAATLVIRTLYNDEPKSTYIRIKDNNGKYMKFDSSSDGYLQSENGMEVLGVNKDNNIYIRDISSGYYTIESIMTDNKYVIPNRQRIQIGNGENYQTTLDLKDNVGSINIKVIDNNGNPISNSKFSIEGLSFNKSGSYYNYSPKGNNVVTSNNYGVIYLKNIPVGTYSVYQSVMKGYSNFANTNISVKFNNTSNLTVINKKDSVNNLGENQSNNTTANRDTNRYISYNNVNSDKGVLNLNVRDSVKDNSYISGSKFKIYRKNTEVKFSKKNNSNNVFEENSSGTSEVVTNDSSISLILPPDKYKLVEISSASGYKKIKDKIIEVKRGIETRVDIKVKREVGNLTLSVKNKAQVAIKGFKYKFMQNNEVLKFKKEDNLYKLDPNGELIELETDENGEINIKELAIGEVGAECIKSLEGYEKPDEVEKISIKANQNNKKEIVAIKLNNRIKFRGNENPLKDVKYKITKDDKVIIDSKTGEDGESEPILEDGNYNMEIVDVPQGFLKPDSVFGIRVDNGHITEGDIIDLEPVVVYAKLSIKKSGQSITLYKDGKSYKTLKTDDEGQVLFETLPYGKYSIKQTDSTDGIISDDEFNFIVDKNYQKPKRFIFKIKTEEEHKAGKIKNIMMFSLGVLGLLLIVTAINVYRVYKTGGSIKDIVKNIKEFNFEESKTKFKKKFADIKGKIKSKFKKKK